MSDAFVRRYGDPSWSTRPVEGQEEAWALLLLDGDKSYEELELERHQVNITEDPKVSSVSRNPLAALAGRDSTVGIVVNSTPWHLHKTLLTSNSTYFKSRLHNSPENQFLLVEPPNPTSFILFVQYIYTNTFDAPTPSDSVHAYILGAKLGADAFKEKPIDKLYALNKWKCTFTCSDVHAIFANTNIGCGLRTLAADLIAQELLTQDLDVKVEGWKEALGQNSGWSEVMTSMARQHLQTWKSKTQEDYHDVL